MNLSHLRLGLVGLAVVSLLSAAACAAQSSSPARDPDPQAPQTTLPQTTPPQTTPPASTPDQTLPDSPGMSRRTPPPTSHRTPAQQAEAERIAHLPIVNGRPYDQPSDHDKFLDYLRDSYELPALGRGTVQALYAEARGKPTGWGTDAAGFGQRFGSALAVQAINGNVRFAGALLLHEDLRYIPCHGCTKKRKIENALLAEITARHGEDGRRFFTLTTTVADFSGPIIAHQLWYPGNAAGPISGVVAARTVFATRIGSHLFEEFVLERHHHDAPLDRD